MADSFLARSEVLANMVGDGNLTGVFAVDGGARTVPLEVGYSQSGPLAGVRMKHFTTPGTGPHAAANALANTHAISLEDIAKTILEEGSQPGMERAVERIDTEFKRTAPRVTGDYADSTARFVIDNGQLVSENYGTHYGEDPGA